MKIKFLTECEAPQERTRQCGDGCCTLNDGFHPTRFYPGDEKDPELWWHKIDLSGLTYQKDYIITEYP